MSKLLACYFLNIQRVPLSPLLKIIFRKVTTAHRCSREPYDEQSRQEAEHKYTIKLRRESLCLATVIEKGFVRRAFNLFVSDCYWMVDRITWIYYYVGESHSNTGSFALWQLYLLEQLPLKYMLRQRHSLRHCYAPSKSNTSYARGGYKEEM